ncbi:MAG: hypothetical protein A3E01_08170 [Gammaproteobacteria bacterium RIFCSPHIGHO2_12_FULL_63_22]|nr:MAG: hypothetical protein A3E01_08170 [Gammaproteobacteria bacterium RIFCSPHIGHO2_12_FULL_63_22]
MSSPQVQEIQRRSNAKRYAANPDKFKARSKAWYDANRERAADYHKAYRARKREERRAYFRAYYERNAECLKARARQLGPIWAAKNVAKVRARAMRRIAAARRATPPWADHDAINAIYSGCVEIERETGISHHVDHIVPLQGKTVCGLHVAANLQIMPGAENQSKGARYWPDMP